MDRPGPSRALLSKATPSSTDRRRTLGYAHVGRMRDTRLMTSDPPQGDLNAALSELVSLLLTTRSMEDFLIDLADTAASTLAVSCGITLRSDQRPLTAAASDSLAAAVDEIQYGTDQGPCLQSLSTATIVSVPDLVDEHRWDGYPAHALAHGIRSSLSLPLSTRGQAVGALNLYARTAHAFDDPAVVVRATALAAQGSAVLGVALHQAQQAHLADQMREALSSRSVIDQAIGILMAQQRCTAGAAFAVLRGASQNRNRKLRDIAADIVTSTGGEPPQQRRFSEPD
jgi:transcriptional regulator with GAF, ATPase, and Fis domain